MVNNKLCASDDCRFFKKGGYCSLYDKNEDPLEDALAELCAEEGAEKEGVIRRCYRR